MAEEDDDRVGYGRPPKHTRFKPGQSGNPAGRRKGGLNVATALAAELHAKMVIRENGRDMRISKAEAMAKALVLKALKGDTKAFAQIMQLLPEQFQSQNNGRAEADITSAERSALERFITRKVNERTVAAAEATTSPAAPNSEEES